MNGYIKIPRRVLASEIWPQGRLTAFEAYADLVRRAAFHAMRVKLGRNEVELERGEILCTASTLVQAWHWPDTTVRDFVRRLETLGFLSRRSCGQYTILSLREGDPNLPIVGEIPAGFAARPGARKEPRAQAESLPPSLEDSRHTKKSSTKKENTKNSFSSLYSFEEEKKKEEFFEGAPTPSAPATDPQTPILRFNIDAVGEEDPAAAARRAEHVAFAKYVMTAMTSNRKLRYDSNIMARLREEFHAQRDAEKPAASSKDEQAA